MTIPLRYAPRALLVVALTACANTTPPRDPAPADGSAAPAPPPSTPVTISSAAAPDAAAGADAGADAGQWAAAPDGGSAVAAPALVADNKVAPTEGEELQERARGLFEAIVKDEPERAEAFWFPREPFIPLKDIKDPGKYWSQLHRTYVNDVHALHAKRKSWDGATFVKFEGWARTKWVPPGDEANKIGYHRAFHGKLRYRVGGDDGEIDVHTIITWQGRWYVTHLRKFKK